MRELPEAIASLLINHPANVFFVIRTLAYDAYSVRLGLVLRSDFAKASHITSALGCALDCVASITGHRALGHCAATEVEVNFQHAELISALRQEFIAETTLDLMESNLALFSSQIHNPDKQIVASASGTLKRLRSNNLVAMADWRQWKEAGAR